MSIFVVLFETCWSNERKPAVLSINIYLTINLASLSFKAGTITSANRFCHSSAWKQMLARSRHDCLASHLQLEPAKFNGARKLPNVNLAPSLGSAQGSETVDFARQGRLPPAAQSQYWPFACWLEVTRRRPSRLHAYVILREV